MIVFCIIVIATAVYAYIHDTVSDVLLNVPIKGFALECLHLCQVYH